MADTVALLSRALSQMTTVLEQIHIDTLDAPTPAATGMFASYCVTSSGRTRETSPPRRGAILRTGRLHPGVGRQLGQGLPAWRAHTQSISLDEGIADRALAWSRRMLQPQFRGEGKAFGEEMPVPADPSAYERLAGWFGRDPYRQPPRTRD